MSVKVGTDNTRGESILDEKDELYAEDRTDVVTGQPTEEEKATLRRVADQIPFAAFTIVVVEFCERFAYYGLSGAFQNYIQNPLPPGGSGSGAPESVDSVSPAGALNQGHQAATGLNLMFTFLSYIFPISSGILADSKWGRYKTIAVSCLVYFVGLVVITVTSIPSALGHGAGLPGWIVGSTIVAMGAGGIKANVSPLVADQYRATALSIRTLPSGERVIVDPNVTITRIYNLFFWCINVGSLAPIATSQLERRIGFWAAFLLPTTVFILTPIALVAGAKLYYRVPPRGSVLVETWRVSRIAMRGFFDHPIQFIRDAKTANVWDRAKPSYILQHPNASAKEFGSSYVTWDDGFVDEVARTARACQIFLFYPIYWTACTQVSTNLISMAGTMTAHGVPNDLLFNFGPITLLVFIPITDIVFYPGLRRMGFNFQPIARIWLGFMFATAAMAYSAVLQHYIYKTNPCGEYVGTCDEPSSINVWVQVPVYVFIAFSEIFAIVTGYEYAYNKAPKRLKSVVMSVFFFMTAIGTAINAALSSVAEDPKLVGLFTGIAVAMFIVSNTFFLCFWRRDRYEEEENAIGKDDLSDEVEAVN